VAESDLLQAGDIVVSTANSAALVGKCALVPQLNYRATIGGFVAALRPDAKLVDAEFLYYWLTSDIAQRRLRSLARQTTNISNLPPSEMARAIIPLPTLKEQERLVTILRQAAELHRLRELMHKTAQPLISSIFNDMFGAPPTWQRPRKLGDCVTILGGGTPSRAISRYYTGAIPWATSKEFIPECRRQV
jgi:type I restriction enzyme S subunit